MFESVVIAICFARYIALDNCIAEALSLAHVDIFSILTSLSELGRHFCDGNRTFLFKLGIARLRFPLFIPMSHTYLTYLSISESSTLQNNRCRLYKL